ncbi:MAG: hypothetical protein ACE5HR_00160 [bacterium]
MIRIDIDAKDIAGKIDEITTYLRNYGDALRTSADFVIYPILERKFDAEGKTKQSSKWDALDPDTVNARLRRIGYYSVKSSEGATGRILHWTHRLRRSVLGKSSESVFELRKEGDKHIMTIGTRVPYAKKLHRKRPIYVIADIRDDVKEFLDEDLRIVVED